MSRSLKLAILGAAALVLAGGYLAGQGTGSLPTAVAQSQDKPKITPTGKLPDPNI